MAEETTPRAYNVMRPGVIPTGERPYNDFYLLTHRQFRPTIFGRVPGFRLRDALWEIGQLGPRRHLELTREDIEKVLNPEERVEPQVELDVWVECNFPYSKPKGRSADAILDDLGL